MHAPSDAPPLYRDVPAILDALHGSGIKLAVASRTPTPHVADAWIDKLGIRGYFSR
jgi:magnesium-dependent phosphatase 1